jgi:DNA-directed RNA polymerase specialized sigma24 family protein
MEEHQWLAQRFDAHRTHLRAVAYRRLGSISEPDDVVQEARLRLSRSDTSGIENLGWWLTTVVGRVCLKGDRRGSNPRPSEPQSADMCFSVLPNIAESAYLSQFVRWYLPAVSGCCALSGVKGGVIHHHCVQVTGT